MLEPKKFELGVYTFEYTPLKLRQARVLYSTILRYYGSVLSSFGESVKIDSNFSLENLLDSDVEKIINPILQGIASGFRELSLSVDGSWLSDTMENILLPQLKISKDGKAVDDEHKKGWYEIEFADKCFLDLKVFINCLRIQYSDFLALFGGKSATIESILKNIKHLNSLKDLTGTSGE